MSVTGMGVWNNLCIITVSWRRWVSARLIGYMQKEDSNKKIGMNKGTELKNFLVVFRKWGGIEFGCNIGFVCVNED